MGNVIITLDDLMLKINEYIHDEEQRQMITKAFYCAEKLHNGQKRQSGEDYINHPLNVAFILAQIYADADTIMAALLHDTIEDTNITKEEIAMGFNKTVAMLVDGVTKIKGLHFNTKDEGIAANQRKIIMSMDEDVRIIIIKLADRLHNMRTIYVKPVEKQQSNALETLEIFVPIAYQLGNYQIKNELSSLALEYLDAEAYKQIKTDLNKCTKNTESTINEMLDVIKTTLEKNHINYGIFPRIKNIYGVYKCLKQGKKLNQIHDLLSIKIMVDDIEACYQTLGIIHSKYRPLNRRFKDYISEPKPNGYKSLHTTVFGPNDNLVQVQIRTFDMQKVNAHGITSYWLNGQEKANELMQQKLREKFEFFKSLVELNIDSNDKDFVNLVKQELLEENIMVRTPKGKMMAVPKGATPIDFAYLVHTDIGNKMNGVLVNNDYVGFDYELQEGDVIKILIDPMSTGPKKEWIDTAITQHAKRKIKEYYNKISR